MSDENADGGDAVTLRVPSMDCAGCADTVGGALDRVDAVRSYDLAPTTGRVEVAYDGDERSLEDAVAAVEDAGYEVEGVDVAPGRSDVWRSTRALATAASAALLAAGLLAGWVGGQSVGPFPLGDALLFGAVAVGGGYILRGGYGSVRTLSLDMDFLMSAAIVGATSLTVLAGLDLIATETDLLVEAASLAVLFNLAELLERLSVERARASLAELVELAPETAAVKRGDDADEVPVEDVAVGETVVVEPGAKVPVDGDVVEGSTAVDEAPVTGESVPADKTVGDEVYAGTINQGGYVEVEATASAADNTISRVVDLVERAQDRKTDREQFVDRFADYYTPVVVSLAILTAVGGALVLGPPVEWVTRGIALLVIACPCAFVISTPVTVVSGVTSAARTGVLVKGGDHLEAAGEVDAVALDKTGTLTTGELEVTDVVPVGADEETLLARAAALEARSEHPIAAAVRDRAAEAGVAAPEVSAFEALTGRGVRAALAIPVPAEGADGATADETWYAGSPALFAERGLDLSAVEERVTALRDEGKTVVAVGTDEELAGLVAVADTVRPEAAEAVARIRDQGLQTVMLTGDNERTARAVAAEVGVDEVRAGLLPEEKVDAVEELSAAGGVAMVGDGINDAPALAAADVGVAMGAAGSDTAIETADVALLGDDLRKLPYLIRLARKGTGIIRQNVYSSLGVKALLAVGIPLGYVSVVVAVLAGDVGMTTLVTGNAMRLSRLDPRSG